jgi:hypothetical protein
VGEAEPAEAEAVVVVEHIDQTLEPPGLPEEAAQQTALTAPRMQRHIDSLPEKFRWRSEERQPDTRTRPERGYTVEIEGRWNDMDPGCASWSRS